jgi:asparagine synthase (glutamine-hydrolysing)
MPFDYKLRNGITKSVLRDGLKGILPEKIRKRYSKLGFVTPEDQWINNNFEKYRMELQNALNLLSDVLEPDSVMKWFDANEGKMRRSDFTPWRIICAGHWVNLFHVELT